LSPEFVPAARIVIAVCVVVTAVLGIVFAHQSGPSRLDTAVYNWLDSELGDHRRALWPLHGLGGFALVTLLTFALALICLIMRRPRGAVLTVVAVVAAALATEFVKPLVDRHFFTGLAYPSGHTTGITSLAAVFAILLLGPLRPPLPAVIRVSLASAGALLAAAVAVALIVTNTHYFTDTVGGAGVGISAALLTALIIDRIASGPRARTGRAQASAASAPDEAVSADRGISG